MTPVLSDLARPRGKYPHFRRAGDYIFVSGLSSRQPDNSIAGATVDAMGTTQLDIRAQTRGVIENLQKILAAAGATLIVSTRAEVTTTDTAAARVRPAPRRRNPRPARRGLYSSASLVPDIDTTTCPTRSCPRDGREPTRLRLTSAEYAPVQV